MQYISPEGLREDGRRPTEIRKLRANLGPIPEADGSVYLEQGNTKILAAVYGPHEPKYHSRGIQEKPIIRCYLSFATFSMTVRRRKPLGSLRTQEISQSIQDALGAALLNALYPKSQIDVYIQVLQADGSVQCASMNAATLAVLEAGIPISDYVCAATATYLQDQPLVDLNYAEESARGPELNVGILPNSGRVVMLQVNSRLHMDELQKVLECATQGCKDVYTVLDNCMKEKITANNIN